MQVVKRIIKFESREEKTWLLIPIGDIHLGHIGCDKDLLFKTLEFIEETPNALWIGMGDYCDAITCKDRRHNLHEIDPDYPTPDVQYRAIEELFRPIASKCIGLLDGNHDYAHWLKHNHNYIDALAYNLKVPYLTLDAYVRLVFTRISGKRPKRNAFNIYTHHGWTNSRTMGYKVNRIQDLAKIFPLCPLYLMGHVHLRGEAPPQVQLFIDNRLRVIHHESRFVFTGCYLRSYMPGSQSYAARLGYPPTTLGSPVIEITVNDQARPPKSPFTITVKEVPR